MLFEGDVYQTIVTALFCALKVNGVQKKKSIKSIRLSFQVAQVTWIIFMVQFCHLITFIV